MIFMWHLYNQQIPDTFLKRCTRIIVEPMNKLSEIHAELKNSLSSIPIFHLKLVLFSCFVLFFACCFMFAREKLVI